MADQKFDPSQIIVGTRLTPTTDDKGVIKVDPETQTWAEGDFEVTIFDRKTGQTLGTHREKVTRRKYEALREDVDGFSNEEVINKWFTDVNLSAASQTELQREADRSSAETRAREAEEEVKRLKEQLRQVRADQDAKTSPAGYDDFAHDTTNVVPVGNTAEAPDNPEQDKDAKDQIKAGGDSTQAPDNPEQRAPSVPEDKSSKKDAVPEEGQPVNKRAENVVPVRSDEETARRQNPAKGGESASKSPEEVVKETNKNVSNTDKSGVLNAEKASK